MLWGSALGTALEGVQLKQVKTCHGRRIMVQNKVNPPAGAQPCASRPSVPDFARRAPPAPTAVQHTTSTNPQRATFTHLRTNQSRLARPPWTYLKPPPRGIFYFRNPRACAPLIMSLRTVCNLPRTQAERMQRLEPDGDRRASRTRLNVLFSP